MAEMVPHLGGPGYGTRPSAARMVAAHGAGDWE